MLTALHIQNIVLIERLQIDFAKGLSALTGETGAGKSILLDALGLALGARSDSGLIRAGMDQAQVVASFDTPALQGMFEESGLVLEDEVILKRQIFVDGKSKAFINDQPVSAALLKQVGAALVEIHGQFDTQALLNSATHQAMLDQFAGLAVQAKDVAQAYGTWQKTEADLAAMRKQAEEADKQKAYLEQAVNDLEELNPQAGEEQILLARRTSVQHREVILTACQTAHDMVLGDDGADIKIVQALRVLEKTSQKAGPVFDDVIQKLSMLRNELDAALSDLESIAQAAGDGDGNLESLDDRIHELRQMARRYNCQPDELLGQLETFKKSLSLVSSGAELIGRQQQIAHQAATEYLARAKKLSTKRQDAAKKLDKAVMGELPPLKLEKAVFKTQVNASDYPEYWRASGIDDVAFLVSTNAGTAAGPLAKIASGGEMARFMLALKVVLVASGGPTCLVFDEVDSGISGATADAVGQRLMRLAQTQQILVITHSPQVAAKADCHFVVQKTTQKNVTTTAIRQLTDNAQRQEEIARMLSGASVTDEARAAAHKLLEKRAA